MRGYAYVLGNYVLMGKFDESLAPPPATNMVYQLVSAVQVESGPRLFWPHFGFFYKAKNTKVKVIFLEKSSGTQHNVLDIMVNELNNEIERESEWKYFSKNISEISFISTAWSGTSDVEWQVRYAIS